MAFDEKIEHYMLTYPHAEEPPLSTIKTPAQIEGIRKAGEINSMVLDSVAEMIGEGVSTQEIDDLVAKRTAELGGICACLGYQGYPKNVCTSIDDVVCHGIPDPKRILQSGDIVNVDCTTIVDILGMNSFMYILPWTTPAPLGIVLGCGITLLSILFAVLVLVVDFVVYYPFFKVYDKQKCEEEDEKGGYVKEEDEDVEVSSDVVNEKRVLVLCAGGGTSGLLANALAKGADEQGISIITAAGSYGAHYDMLKDYDLVVLAPQVANYYEDLKKDTDRIGIKCVACEGKKYIELTRNPQKALQFVFSILDGEE